MRWKSNSFVQPISTPIFISAEISYCCLHSEGVFICSHKTFLPNRYCSPINRKILFCLNYILLSALLSYYGVLSDVFTSVAHIEALVEAERNILQVLEELPKGRHSISVTRYKVNCICNQYQFSNQLYKTLFHVIRNIVVIQ